MKRRKTWLGISGGGAGASPSPASSPRASTSASSSPAAASSTTRSARRSRSTRRARPSPTPASPRPSCRPPTPPTSPSAPARSPTTRSSGSRTRSPRSAAPSSKVDDQTIGASLGDELRNKALIAFGVAFLAQLLYLAIRFKWTFGVAAVLAMAHDVVLVVGLFAWLQKPIDGIFLAAAMTIIGLSVNDTVVVFDRIRERWCGSRPEDDFIDDGQQGRRRDHAAHGQHRPRLDVHPGRAGRPRRRLAAGLRDRAARRPRGRHLLLGLHRHPAPHLLPGEVADEPGEEGEGRARRPRTPARSSDPASVRAPVRCRFPRSSGETDSWRPLQPLQASDFASKYALSVPRRIGACCGSC